MSGGWLRALCLAQLVLAVLGQKKWSLDMSPSFFHAPQTVTTISLMCRADSVALSACQFVWRDQMGGGGQVLDLSQGPATRANVSLLSPQLTGYAYRGAGLRTGECGVTLTIHGWKLWMVGCRARASHGGWRYAWMSLVARDYEPISLTVIPREMAVLPGQDLLLMCRARKESLTDCKFLHPKHVLDFGEGAESSNSSGRHIYSGAGLDQGDCGLKLTQVSTLDNGPFICDLSTSRGWEQRHIPVIVAQKPSLPVLELLESKIYAGNALKARCTVGRSRPVATITWFLGVKVIRRDGGDDSSVGNDDIWRWPWDLASHSQTISYKLKRKDDGKILKCLVKHMTLTTPLEASMKISFGDPPDFGKETEKGSISHGEEKSVLSLTPYPEHVRIDKLENNVTFNCDAEVSLSSCQFRWTFSLHEEMPVLDCSKGAATVTELPEGFGTFSYNSSGLESGKCAITLAVKGYKAWVVGCRVRTPHGAWKYSVMDLYAKSGDVPAVPVTPKTIVVRPGDPLSVMCSLPNTRHCFFTFHGHSGPLNFTNGLQSKDSIAPHLYQGSGLTNGECGLRLANVTEENNGPATCLMVGNDNAHQIGYFFIIIAKPPNAPVLSVSPEGDNLTASCFVSGSRPEPNITWYLDDRILRQDSINDAPTSLEDNWIWPWSETTVLQKLVYKLGPKDGEKTLKCVVSHLALTSPLEAVHELSSSLQTAHRNTISLRDAHATTSSNTTTFCPRLRSSSLDMSCSYKCRPVACNAKAMPTTEALLMCKEGFSSTSDEDNRTITCQENGRWSDKQLICTTGCGLRSSVHEFIRGGHEAELKDYPWHVGIYRKQDENTATHICGGTIISTLYVISAAHCFWNGHKQKKQEADRYKVVAGKHRREWGAKDPHEQRKNLARIFMHERYRGRPTHHSYDLAVLQLKTPFKLGTVVKLVCIDWKGDAEQEQLVAGNNGTVAGWGVTEGGRPSDVLLAVDLPYVPYLICMDSLDQDARAWLTYDKFCAGFYHKNTSVCRGDSGGGIVFHQRATKRFYLQGVVSSNFAPGNHSGPECYAQHYTAFTQLSVYHEWIRKIISSVL